MSLYSRMDRVVADVERLERKVDSVSNSPQAQRTSIEAGTMDINDEDGNLISTIGFQEDGSGATRFFDGPIPPVPAGFTALADGPLIQGTWDGTFQDGVPATYDLAYLEVAATLVEDSGKVSFTTISAKEGASASVVANQTGSWAVAVRSVSQAGKKSEFFSAGTVEVKITDLSGAIEAVQDSANGKNKITWSLRAPTSEDLGAVGDTWWVNEARTREDGSAYLAIIAQHQYQSDGWVQVEMAHEVIASVDLGTATVGELDGIRIRSKTVGADQLSADFADFVVARGGTFLTMKGDSWSDDGLFIFAPDGTSLVRFPTDGTPLSLTASDVQIDRATIGELDTIQQTVRSGGTVTLASGVTAPASPPDLSNAWQRNVQLPRPADASMDWTGLANWNDKYVRGVNVLGSAGDNADRIEVYNLDGTLNKSIPIDLNPRAGVAVIGDIVYTIGPDHVAANVGKQWCHGFNLDTGERVSRWEYVHFFASNQKKIAIGVDGSNLIVAGVAPNTELSVFKYSPSTGSQVGVRMFTSFDVGYAADIHGVGVLGGKVYVSPRGQVREYSVNGGTLTKTPGFAWDNPNWNSGGFVFVGGVPLVVDSGGVYTGSSFSSGTTLQACYTWWNGAQETTPSLVSSTQILARESVTVSMAKRSGLQKRLYVRTGTSGNWYRQVVGTDVTSLAISDFGTVSGWGSLFPLPTANTFPASTPAVLKSGGGNFEARGDGSGKWGPLTFNANGTMTGLSNVAAGSGVEVVVPSGAGFATKAVTFPTGRFANPPAVTLAANSSAETLINIAALSVTKDGFTLSVRRTNTTATLVDWIAMEVN